jgi:hypothetical protein
VSDTPIIPSPPKVQKKGKDVGRGRKLDSGVRRDLISVAKAAAATGTVNGVRSMSKPRANKPNALTTIPRLPGKITATSWTPPTSGMSYEQWLATGKRIIAIGIASAWWIGDWWNASVAYGERVESAGHLPLSLKTIRTYAWVAQNVSIRMDTLSFSHHSIVASLPAAEQKQWLGRAAKQHWSVERMREAIEHRESTIGTFPAGVAARGDAEPADDAEAAEAADAAAQPSRDNNIFDGVFDDDDGEVSIQPPDGPAGDDDRPGVEQVLARYLKGINAMLDVVKPSMRELLIGDDTVEVATKLRPMRSITSSRPGATRRRRFAPKSLSPSASTDWSKPCRRRCVPSCSRWSNWKSRTGASANALPTVPPRYRRAHSTLWSGSTERNTLPPRPDSFSVDDCPNNDRPCRIAPAPQAA